MIGRYEIDIYTKRIRYHLTIERNITVISGNSATGKTELIRLISAYNANPASSGVSVSCSKKCRVLTSDDWQIRLDAMNDSIIFIDEGNEFVKSIEFAKKIQGSDNYYVIVTRDGIDTLPYSIKSIVGFRTAKNRFNNAGQIYNEQYQLYSADKIEGVLKPAKIITEDTGAGYQFFENVANQKYIECGNAGGKGNVSLMIKSETIANTLYIVDGAAFGSDIAKAVENIKENRKCYLYAPESFEWLILKSGVLNYRMDETQKSFDISDWLEKTYDYADSVKYFSWERFYTEKLIAITHGNKEVEYSKKNIAPYYLRTETIKRILAVMEKIEL